jgi:hypothetical protein
VFTGVALETLPRSACDVIAAARKDSASPHRRTACILSRVVERTLPSSALLRNPCRIPQQLADLSQYFISLGQCFTIKSNISVRPENFTVAKVGKI